MQEGESLALGAEEEEHGYVNLRCVCVRSQKNGPSSTPRQCVWSVLFARPHVEAGETGAILGAGGDVHIQERSRNQKRRYS